MVSSLVYFHTQLSQTSARSNSSGSWRFAVLGALRLVLFCKTRLLLLSLNHGYLVEQRKSWPRDCPCPPSPHLPSSILTRHSSLKALYLIRFPS